VADVRDVAHGHVLALEHGRPGERDLLGGVDLTLRELFAAVADLAGRPRPVLPFPTPGSGSPPHSLRYRPGPVEPALRRAVDETRSD
jgi:nucleoside-diphosphate-sugar epimerase